MGKNNKRVNFMKKQTDLPRKKSPIQSIIPRLVQSNGRDYLVYGGLLRGIKIPATPEQAKRHLNCLMQHLQEVAHG